MVSSSGFMLGVIGGLLDFASATSLLVDRAAQSGMGGIGSSYIAVALGLYVLGALVIVTSLFSSMLVGMSHPSLFSILMIAYGVAMVAAGWIISTDIISTAISSLYSLGMIALGVLMVVNAFLALRSRVEV
jgi:hypothetical protein